MKKKKILNLQYRKNNKNKKKKWWKYLETSSNWGTVQPLFKPLLNLSYHHLQFTRVPLSPSLIHIFPSDPRLNDLNNNVVQSTIPDPNLQSTTNLLLQTHKIALITRITSWDGTYLTEFLSTNGFLSWFWICKMCWWLVGHDRGIFGVVEFSLWNLWVLQIMCCICRCVCDQALMVLS